MSINNVYLRDKSINERRFIMSGKISKFVQSLYANQNGRTANLVENNKDGNYKVVHRSNKTGYIELITQAKQNKDGTVTRTDTDAYGNSKRSLTFNPKDDDLKTIYRNQFGLEISKNEFDKLD